MFISNVNVFYLVAICHYIPNIFVDMSSINFIELIEIQSNSISSK